MRTPLYSGLIFVPMMSTIERFHCTYIHVIRAYIIHVHLYIHTYIHTYMYILHAYIQCTYTYTCIHTHVYTHVHIHVIYTYGTVFTATFWSLSIIEISADSTTTEKLTMTGS